MWFMLGFITLIAGGIGFARYRNASMWSPIPSTLNDQSFLYDVSEQKHTVTIRIGVTCATGLYFCLKPEGFLDRFFKFLGLSEEQQLAHVSFDQNIYMLSDDKRLGEILKNNTPLIEQIEALFRDKLIDGSTVQKLWCQSGRLRVDIQSFNNRDFLSAQSKACVLKLAETVLPVLTQLGIKLSENAPKETGSRDKFLIKASLLLGINTVFVAAGALFFIQRLIFRNADIKFLDIAQLSVWSLSMGIAITLAMITACILLLGKTSRAHWVLIEIMTLGFIGATVTSVNLIYNYNQLWGTRTSWQEQTTILSKYTTSCGRRSSNTCYNITISETKTSPNGTNFRVFSHHYNKFTVGSKVSVTYHQGALGLRWADTPKLLP
jgi:hypothetical protein